MMKNCMEPILLIGSPKMPKDILFHTPGLGTVLTLTALAIVAGMLIINLVS